MYAHSRLWTFCNNAGHTCSVSATTCSYVPVFLMVKTILRGWSCAENWTHHTMEEAMFESTPLPRGEAGVAILETEQQGWGKDGDSGETS